MAAEDLALVYMALHDDDAVRSSIAGGDFGAVNASGLDEYERRLLIDAATEELPDVSGFAFQPGRTVTVWAPYHYIATQYVVRNLTAPEVQASFVNWQSHLGVNPEG